VAGKTLLGMCLLRVLSGCIELSAAMLMWHFGSIPVALRINGVLGVCGPLVLLLATGLGLSSLAGQVPPSRLLLILAGVSLIFLGTRWGEVP
jgi:hypothetical protein